MANVELESIIKAWCREILPAVHSAWGFNVNDVSIRVESNGQLNAMIEGSRKAYRITISENLIKLLSIFNQNMFAIGWKMVFEGDSMISATEPLMRDVLALVFAMDPPGDPTPQIVDKFTKPGFDEYRQQYEVEAKKRLNAQGTDFLVKVTANNSNVETTAAGLENIANKLSDIKTKFQLLECQVKFLILHELAHAHLEHLDKEHTPELEIEADRLASDVYLKASKALREAGDMVIDTAALVTLLSAVGFVEDLIRLVDRSIEFGIPEAFRKAHQPILRSHPCTRLRAAEITRHLWGDGITQLVAHLNEKAIYEMKLQFRMGVIDYRRFKWYCRVRGLEMQASWTMRNLLIDERGQDFADKIDIVRGSDTIDLQWGPLVDDIFPHDWHQPVALPAKEVTQ